VDDNEFWLGVWKIVGAVVAAMIFAVMLSSLFRARMLSEAIAGGAEPMRAACAFNGVERDGVCQILAAK
jgi:hypothetical protein